MKVYLAAPEARPLFNYIVQEFGYQFSDNKDECDILVCPDQGRSREEGVALDQLFRHLHLRSSKRLALNRLGVNVILRLLYYMWSISISVSMMFQPYSELLYKYTLLVEQSYVFIAAL